MSDLIKIFYFQGQLALPEQNPVPTQGNYCGDAKIVFQNYNLVVPNTFAELLELVDAEPDYTLISWVDEFAQAVHKVCEESIKAFKSLLPSEPIPRKVVLSEQRQLANHHAQQQLQHCKRVGASNRYFVKCKRSRRRY